MTTESVAPWSSSKHAERSAESPYPDFADVTEEGHGKYMAAAATAATAAAGGGIAPPLTRSYSIYGDDNDTLFRLIALGTGKFESSAMRLESATGGRTEAVDRANAALSAGCTRPMRTFWKMPSPGSGPYCAVGVQQM